MRILLEQSGSALCTATQNPATSDLRYKDITMNKRDDSKFIALMTLFLIGASL